MGAAASGQGMAVESTADADLSRPGRKQRVLNRRLSDSEHSCPFMQGDNVPELYHQTETGKRYSCVLTDKLLAAVHRLKLVQIVDPSGKKYWYNKVTKATAWYVQLFDGPSSCTEGYAILPTGCCLAVRRFRSTTQRHLLY